MIEQLEKTEQLRKENEKLKEIIAKITKEREIIATCENCEFFKKIGEENVRVCTRME